MMKLSERTERLVARLFVDEVAGKVVSDKLETECGNGIP